MSFVAPGAHAPGYGYAAASRLYLSRGVVTRACVPLLRGFAASSQKDGIDAATCVAASRLVHNCNARIPGAHAPGYGYAAASRLRRITPQGWRCLGGECRRFAVSHGRLMRIADPAGSRLHLSRGVVTRACVPLLHGFAASSQKDGVDAATCVAASRLIHIVMPVFLGLTPQAINMPPLRGSGGSPRKDGGHPVCRFRDARPAPKARQIFSLGREPQEAVHPTPTSPEGATDS